MQVTLKKINHKIVNAFFPGDKAVAINLDVVIKEPNVRIHCADVRIQIGQVLAVVRSGGARIHDSLLHEQFEEQRAAGTIVYHVAMAFGQYLELTSIRERCSQTMIKLEIILITTSYRNGLSSWSGRIVRTYASI